MKIHPLAIQWRAVSGRAFLLCGLAMALMTGSARAAGCPIEGPTTVSANESFTLCGGPGNGYTYEWLGQGQASSSASRCLTESGRSTGTYEYQLIVRRYGTEIERCSHTVTVGSGGFGTLTCAISGPTSIASGSTANLCAPQASRHSYHWTGPGGFTASTPCVTASLSGIYHVSIVNDLTGYARECSHTLTVGTSGARCAIDGPDVIGRGSNVQLCAPASSDANYRWDGPNNFVAASRCVVVDVAGTYYLTIRSRSTGVEEQCSHRLAAVETGTEGCTISGPSSIGSGNTAELCSESYSNSIYTWTGPGNFRSSLRCIRVTVPGVYRLSIRNQVTRFVRECSYTLDDGYGETDDGDVVTSDNCPRALPFWQQQCRRAANGRRLNPNDFVLADLQAIARRVDELSTYFNWPDDVTGLCAALNPVNPLTNRKQAIRHFAALLANVAAGELDIRTRNGDAVSLDPATSGSFSSASTVGELIALAERMLKSGRGSFAQLSQQLNAVNRGRGIGPVCQ
jgi:hypothetical protein